MPIRNECTADGQPQASYARDLSDYFAGPRWAGTGATKDLEDKDADFVDGVMQKAQLFPTIQVDRSQLSHSHEAWIHVTVSGDGPSSLFPLYAGFTPYPRPGILTWENSD